MSINHGKLHSLIVIACLFAYIHAKFHNTTIKNLMYVHTLYHNILIKWTVLICFPYNLNYYYVS